LSSFLIIIRMYTYCCLVVKVVLQPVANRVSIQNLGAIVTYANGRRKIGERHLVQPQPVESAIMRLDHGSFLLIAAATGSILALVRCASPESAGSEQRGARGNVRELSAIADGVCERLDAKLDDLYAEQRRLAADIAAIKSAALRAGCIPSSGTPMVQMLPVHAESVGQITSPTRRRANYTLLTVRTSGRPRVAACFRGRASIACTRRPAFDRLAPGSTCQTSPARLSLAAVYRSQPARRGA
jgi:hypothetical protein